MSELIPVNSEVAGQVSVIPTVTTPMEMISTAIQNGVKPEELTQLFELQERWEASEARKAFNEAMTAFKSNPPDIVKNKHVAFSGTAYDHASLDHVAEVISAAMSPHGLSFRWDINQSEQVTVTCIIMHSMGHSEKTPLSGPPDDSGKKNKIQQIASTVSYLQRYTLLSATGLAARGMDDDGRGSVAPPAMISEEQVANLQALFEEVGGDLGLLLKPYDVIKFADLPCNAYDRVITRLEAKRSQG